MKSFIKCVFFPLAVVFVFASMQVQAQTAPKQPVKHGQTAKPKQPPVVTPDSKGTVNENALDALLDDGHKELDVSKTNAERSKSELERSAFELERSKRELNEATAKAARSGEQARIAKAIADGLTKLAVK